MAPLTIPRSPSAPRPDISQADASGAGKVASLTPTRQTARRHSPPPTVRTDLTRAKITHRDVDQDTAARFWSTDTFCEAGGLPASAGRPCAGNLASSTVLSKTNSGLWSGEDSDASSAACSSLPMASRLFSSVPPPQPLPSPRGATDFRPPLPPPPWRAPVGTFAGYKGIPRSRSGGFTSSEFESEESELVAENVSNLSGRREELEAAIDSKRRCLWELRDDMAKKRKELRELRAEKDRLDNAFMHLFRAQLTSNSQFAVVRVDLVADRFHAMQKIRDKYYAAESAYEDMESRLDQQELEIDKLEVNLSRIVQGRPDFRPQGHSAALAQSGASNETTDDEAKEDSHVEVLSRPPTPFTLRGISAELPEDIHPLYQELLDVAGDRQLAEEYCEDIEMQRETILYGLEIQLHRKRVRNNQGNLISEEELRSLRSSLANVPADVFEFEARFGIPISEDDLEFLRDYEAVSARARKDLDAVSQTLAHIRALCIKKQVMRKHASYHEQLAIYSGYPGWSPPPFDGNMTIEPSPPPPPPPPPPPRPPPPPSRNPADPSPPPPPSWSPQWTNPHQAPSLAHPRFPVLLSNPSHLLRLQTPLQALEAALALPRDDPAAALRRAECMKELGIEMLMKHRVDDARDLVNQWLVHRLRTCPLEAELLLTVAEDVMGGLHVANLRRWQEEVLAWWRADGAGLRGGDGDGGSGGSGSGCGWPGREGRSGVGSGEEDENEDGDEEEEDKEDDAGEEEQEDEEEEDEGGGGGE